MEPAEVDDKLMKEVGKYFKGVHLPEHPGTLKTWTNKSQDHTVESATGSEHVVNGWLITVKKDGEEKVFFRDQQGKLHPVIGAKITPVIKVNLLVILPLTCQ